MLTKIGHGCLLFTRRDLAIVLVLFGSTSHTVAAVKLPALFSDHMVLQREADLPIWGWADPGEKVTVTLPGQILTTEADDAGRWQVTAQPLTPGNSFTLVIEGSNRIEIADVQVGDVWLCSGQSNMEMSVGNSSEADLEVPAANYPSIRMITVATQGGQAPLDNFDGHWEVCTPESISGFSAVGYFFGRELHQQLRVPIGLIDNAWGGSACEAWIRRDLLEEHPLYEKLLKEWDARMEVFDEKQAQADFDQRLKDWEEQAAAARLAGEPEPPNRPWWDNPATGQHRPANLYNGRIKPLMPFAIRGAIWYQGETNAGRAYQYREMFPLMIKNWRDDWGQGEFPFYFVQLADFLPEADEPGESAWAELREAQTMTVEKLPNTGQAVIIDLGEANDIHPRNKQDVARRLARLALNKTYNQELAHESPRFSSLENQGSKLVVRFKDVDGKLRTPEGKPVAGFAIAGADRKWVWAAAEIVGDAEVAVHSDSVPEPAAVRYAWADNPICNLYDSAGLPATPFRSDDWPGVTANAK